MIFLALLAIVVVAVLVLEYWGRSRLAVFKLSAHGGIRAALRTPLTNGMDDSVLAIHVIDPDRSLVFRKYVRSPNDAGFQMELSRQSWSESYWDTFRSLLGETGATVVETREDRYLWVPEILAREFRKFWPLAEM